EPAKRKLADLLGPRHATSDPELRHDPVDDRLELVALDRSLYRRPLEPGKELRAIEGLALPASLADVERALVVALVGSEPALAATALAPAPDGVLLAQACVDDVRLGVAAEWTAHNANSTSPRAPIRGQPQDVVVAKSAIRC